MRPFSYPPRYVKDHCKCDDPVRDCCRPSDIYCQRHACSAVVRTAIICRLQGARHRAEPVGCCAPADTRHVSERGGNIEGPEEGELHRLHGRRRRQRPGSARTGHHRCRHNRRAPRGSPPNVHTARDPHRDDLGAPLSARSRRGATRGPWRTRPPCRRRRRRDAPSGEGRRPRRARRAGYGADGAHACSQQTLELVSAGVTAPGGGRGGFGRHAGDCGRGALRSERRAEALGGRLPGDGGPVLAAARGIPPPLPARTLRPALVCID